MRKKVICLTLSTMLFALSVNVGAQQPTKIPRIGYLSPVDPATESPRSEADRQALRERGYIEGQNIAIEYRYAEGNRDRASAHAAEVVRLNVDIIVAAGGDALLRDGQECDQDHSDRYGGHRDRSCQSRPG
jgi:putative tryptophan/tyrosine transport system substrate-binding protein